MPGDVMGTTECIIRSGAQVTGDDLIKCVLHLS